MKVASIALLISTLATASAARRTEGDVHQCACEAEEFAYKIDCSNTEQMLTSLTYLGDNNCAADCMAAECERNWLIVQTHHDYCPEAGIPELIEDGFHDYDESCKACEIGRLFTEGAPDCPAPNCEDTSGNDAYTSLVELNCVTDCSSDACRDHYFTLRVVHDVCDHDVLDQTAEEGLHDMEASCAAQVCNIVGAEDAPLECHDDHDDHDDHDEHETLDDHDEHTSKHSCACEAEEFDFDIDCSNTNVMLDAMTFLKTNSCSTDCSKSGCEKNYLIVQSHHDYCPEENIPEEVEDGFHDYDETCVACEIGRVFMTGAPICPAANCGNNSGNDAYAFLVDGDCGLDCSSTECRDAFFILRVVHDECDHNTLSRASEEGLHDLEVSCVNQVCNIAGAENAPLECHDDHSSHDGEPSVEKPADATTASAEESGATTATVTAAAALVGAAMMMA